MSVQTFLERLRPYKTVVQRTRPRPELPAQLLYTAWVVGEGKRKLLDLEGEEHLLPEKVLESNYKIATGSLAKKLIKEHWANAKPA